MDIFDEVRFDYLSPENKSFLLHFDREMGRLGYGFGGEIGSGYCWGKHMLIYRRSGAKSPRVFARVYLRETGISLRYFLNDIDRHRKYLESAPGHIQAPFIGPYGDCRHCHNEKDGKCRFRKSYTLFNRFIEKCNGYTFEFPNSTVEKLPDYIALFLEIFPARQAIGSRN